MSLSVFLSSSGRPHKGNDLPHASDIKGEGLIVRDELHLGTVISGKRDRLQISVVIAPGGYVVIHKENLFGRPGSIIGVSEYLSLGKHDGVVIITTEAMHPGQRLIAMLYSDNGDKKFTSAKEDIPIIDSGKYFALLHMVVGEN